MAGVLPGLLSLCTPVASAKTVADVNVPEPLVASPTYVSSVEFVAQKGQNSANTGTVYLGWQSTNGSQTRPMAPGDKWTINAPDGQKLDLSQIYIDAANAGDGVTWVSLP